MRDSRNKKASDALGKSKSLALRAVGLARVPAAA
jgi:hypothetical protein